MDIMSGVTFYFDWEISLLNWFQNIHTSFGDKFWGIITLFGAKGLFWVVLSLVILLTVKDKRVGWTMVGALFIDVLLCNVILKNVVQRNRPFWIFPDIPLVDGVAVPDDYSFPSGHTGASFAAATALFARNKKWGVPAFVLAALICISRMYLFVHFPTDVLAGVVIGVFAGICSFFIVNAFYKDKDLKKYMPIFGQPF